MAKKSMIERQNKRCRLKEAYEFRRAVLKSNRLTLTKFLDKQNCNHLLHALPRNSNPTRLNNRCIITGRVRGILPDFGLSRQTFREMAHQGLLPGIKKSSW